MTSAVVLIIAGVVGLARLTMPDVPTFAETLEAAEDPAAVPVVLESIGAELEVTGEKEGTFSLTREYQGGAGYGLSGDDGRIIFQTDDELTVGQMVYDGLNFFLDPDDCTVSPGDLQEATGLALVDIECVDVTDVQNEVTLTLRGPAALPADLVVERHLPEVGGELTLAGDVNETVAIGFGSWEVTPEGVVSFNEFDAYLSGDGISLGLVAEDGNLTVAVVTYDEIENPVTPDACQVADEHLAALNPTTELVELAISCSALELENVGTVSLEGSVVIEQTRPFG